MMVKWKLGFISSGPIDLGCNTLAKGTLFSRIIASGASKPNLLRTRRTGGSRRTERKNSVDWTFSSLMHTERMTSDVIAPSPWKIFGFQNGLRLFKEAKDWDSRGRHWDDHPAIMAVGVVDGTSEAIFRTLLSLGPSRSDVLADGISVTTGVAWLRALMVIQILFTSSYTVIGYPGKWL